MQDPFKIKGYKKKKICLIDVDGSMANLALMKISTFFKKKKWEVELIRLNRSGYNNVKRDEFKFDAKDYDKIFISSIFTFNKNLVDIKNCKEVYRDGMSLPYDIEHSFPDYSLYPDNEYSIGFFTRGCIRKCEFCIVPQKEGLLRVNAPLEEFYNPKLPKIMLFDNNILAYSKCIDVLKQLKETSKKITFKQGMDFRLMTKEKAEILSTLNYEGEFIFAFDNPKDMSTIKEKLKIWQPFVKDWQTKFYVLVGFNSTLKEDLERVFFLKKNKCLAYVMRYQSMDNTKGCYSSPFKDFYTDLASWCNQPGFFKNMTFPEFIKKRHATEERLMRTMNIVRENQLVIN